MAIPKNFFRDMLRKNNIKVNVFGCQIDVKAENLGIKLDRAQDMLDAQVWGDVQMYMPHDTGNLIDQTNIINQATRGEVYLFPPESDYGHYMYEGTLYVDPVTGSSWARKNVEKVPKVPFQPLNYSKEDAKAHWGEVAQEKHKKQWIEAAKKGLK